MSRVRLTLLGALLFSGCSAIPAGRDAPARLADAGVPTTHRLAVAPVTMSLGAGERAKGYSIDQVVDEAEVQRELAAWAEASGVFSSVKRLPAATRAGDVLLEAWNRREDLVLEVAIERIQTRFEGHNGWWIPNIINWIAWMVPAWFVATEEYSLDCTARIQLRSVDTGRVVFEDRVRARVEGTFDEFDRGWQFFGFIYPRNDGENWRRIAEQLLPAARSKVGLALARSLNGPARAKLGGPAEREQLGKTLALVLGVSHYRDALKLPTLAYATSDARALAATLRAGPLLTHHVSLKTDAAVTAEGIKSAIAELRARLHPRDQLLIYFAGYGSRDAQGRAQIVLADGSPLDLLELGRALAPIRAKTLVVLDCGFEGQGRSIAATSKRAGLAISLGATSRAGLLCASRPGSALLTPSHVRSSLLAHHLVAAIGGAADRDRDGRVGADELLAYVRDRVRADSAYLGDLQRPRGVGIDPAWEFKVTRAPKE